MGQRRASRRPAPSTCRVRTRAGSRLPRPPIPGALPMYDVRALNELVAKESAFVDRLTNEVGKVIVGQHYMVERILVGLLTGGHVLLEGVPGLAKTLTVRTLCDAIAREVRAHPVHAGPAPGRPRGHGRLQPAEGRVHVQARPHLRQPRPRRRDQPRARQGAERAARGDAGAAGHHRRQDVPAARAVHRHGDAEPHRAGGHLRRCPRRRSTASCSW